VNHDDAVAIQWLACNMTDNPEQFRKPPMQAIIEQCYDARYSNGDDESGIAALDCPF
jgi:hypothetical protein